MARSTTSRSRSSSNLSDKLSSSRNGNDQLRSTRKRLSLTSATTHSTAASSGAMPLVNVVATPISPQQPFDRKKISRSSGDKSRRRRSSVSRDRRTRGKSRDKSRDRDIDRNRSFSSSSVTNFDHEEWDEPDPIPVKQSRTPSTERRHAKVSTTKSSKDSRRKSSRTPPSSRMSSSSRPSSSRGRSRRDSSSRKDPPPAASPKSPQSPSLRKRISSSKSKRSSDNMRSSSRTKSKARRNTSFKEQSLTSFMQKETSSRPKEGEDALETKSAFTSVSRSRNRNKTIDASISVSYHGVGARRNTRSFRDMMAAKAANSEKEEENRKSRSSYRRSVSEDLQQKANSSFRRSVSEDLGGSSFQQHHQSFASLPVLREESKKPKKSSKSKNAKKSNKKSSGVSPQELSDFLEQCNAKRKQKEAKGKNGRLSSPVSGDRSCVSMPALTSSSSIGGKHVRKPTRHSPKASLQRLHVSLSSFQTSQSDPLHDTITDGRIEKREEKGQRARSSSRTRSRTQRNNSSKNLGARTRDDSASSEGKRRSKSAGKALKSWKKEKGADKPRSLSRSRRSGQTKERALSRPKSPRPTSSRPKGFQKLFSIRDLKSVSDSEAGMMTPAPLMFKREDTSSAWAPRTPSNSQREGHEMDGNHVPMTPPPPLAPHSPLRSDRGLRSMDSDGSGIPSIPRSSASDLDWDSDARSVEEVIAEEGSPSGRSSRNSSAKKISVQHSGDDTAEGESEHSMNLGVEYETSSGVDADMVIEEDVFSHYTWANDATATGRDHDQIRQARKHLKESIRESLLFSAFEAFEM